MYRYLQISINFGSCSSVLVLNLAALLCSCPCSILRALVGSTSKLVEMIKVWSITQQSILHLIDIQVQYSCRIISNLFFFFFSDHLFACIKSFFLLFGSLDCMHEICFSSFFWSLVYILKTMEINIWPTLILVDWYVAKNNNNTSVTFSR